MQNDTQDNGAHRELGFDGFWCKFHLSPEAIVHALQKSYGVGIGSVCVTDCGSPRAFTTPAAKRQSHRHLTAAGRPVEYTASMRTA